MILGLTGAFGGGKSTVLKYFHAHNWFTFDADRECHVLYTSGNAQLISAVRELFGAAAITGNGEIDRAEIARQAFDHPEKMKSLTAALYPLLNAVMAERINECRSKNISGIFELPLLYEANYQNCFDAVVAVWTDPEVRCQHLKQRNFSKEEMMRRDARQMPPEQKVAKYTLPVQG